MAKKKRSSEYRFLTDITYAPLGDASYIAGQINPLADWDAGAVERALKAGLIEHWTEQEEVAALPVENESAGEEGEV